MVQQERRPSLVAFSNNNDQKPSVYKVPILLEWQPKTGRVIIPRTTTSTGTEDRQPRVIKEHIIPQRTSSRLFVSKIENTTTNNNNKENIDDNNTEDTFEEDALKAHNVCRSNHGVPPLSLSQKLTRHAQSWANVLARDDRFEHNNDNQDYGENLYCTWSSNPNVKCSGKKPVDSWYDEIKSYMFGVEPDSMETGHFTQLVWRESTCLGIAKARTKHGKEIVVANYDPPGNWVGSYTDNVPALKSRS